MRLRDSPPATSPVLGVTAVTVGRWALPEIFQRCPWAVTGVASGMPGSPVDPVEVMVEACA